MNENTSANESFAEHVTSSSTIFLFRKQRKYSVHTTNVANILISSTNIPSSINNAWNAALSRITSPFGERYHATYDALEITSSKADASFPVLVPFPVHGGCTSASRNFSDLSFNQTFSIARALKLLQFAIALLSRLHQ